MVFIFCSNEEKPFYMFWLRKILYYEIRTIYPYDLDPSFIDKNILFWTMISHHNLSYEKTMILIFALLKTAFYFDHQNYIISGQQVDHDEYRGRAKKEKVSLFILWIFKWS